MSRRPRTLRAVLYARVSTGRQDERAQLRRLRTLAVERRWSVVAVEVDHVTGDPARRTEPPALRRSLAAIDERRADVLAVFAADRLVRSPRELLDLVGRIQRSGGHVVSAMDGADVDTTTDAGELLTFLRGWFSRMELRLGRARTMAGLERARAAGVQLGRPRADVDTFAARQAMQGGNSLRQVARWMGVAPSTLQAALHRSENGAAKPRARSDGSARQTKLFE